MIQKSGSSPPPALPSLGPSPAPQFPLPHLFWYVRSIAAQTPASPPSHPCRSSSGSTGPAAGESDLPLLMANRGPALCAATFVCVKRLPLSVPPLLTPFHSRSKVPIGFHVSGLTDAFAVSPHPPVVHSSGYPPQF